jgi:putative DNA primase/helicase
VRPVIRKEAASKGRKTRIAVLVPVDHGWLKSAMTERINFMKWNKGAAKLEPIGPPSDVVRTVLSRYGHWPFPKVTGIITCPTMRSDGSILAKEGLDEATGLLVVGPLPKMPPVKDQPTRRDAELALAIIEKELEEFPFEDEASKSAALSGWISPVVRGALDCVPMHALTAPTPGTGKSYLADLIATTAIGDAMPTSRNS